MSPLSSAIRFLCCRRPARSTPVCHSVPRARRPAWVLPLALVAGACLAALPDRLQGQVSSGGVDTTFNVRVESNGSVSAIATQADGTLYVAGTFVSVDGAPQQGIARLNRDGSIDPSFQTGTGPNDTIRVINLQTDGKILIGGAFDSFNGQTANHVARLNPDGTLDTAFSAAGGADDNVLAISAQDDGTILLGGEFLNVNGAAHAFVVRLIADGTTDPTFKVTSAPDDAVNALSVDANGGVVIGGNFLNLGKTPRAHVARLKTDGSLDTAFDPGAGTDQPVASVLVEDDGLILIGGAFTTYDGVAANNLARVDANGKADPGFNAGTGPDGPVSVITQRIDGLLVIGGAFSQYDVLATSGVARLNRDGTPDTTFAHTNSGADPGVTALSLQEDDGTVFIGGNLSPGRR